MKDDKLLKNVIISGIKLKIVLKRFRSELVYNRTYKSKTKFNKGKININFHDHGMPKEGLHCICLSAILIDSVFKISKNY